MMSSFLLTADGVFIDQPTTEQASFLRHRTETFLLPDLESGTICHQNCDSWISALDNLETAHRDFDYCALEVLLLTYLLTYIKKLITTLAIIRQMPVD